MNSLKISVIIPLYNAENTIEKCLDSVAIQKPNYEIEVIIVNDGSTDNSKNIVDNYIKKSNLNINFISQNNKGVSAARNMAIKMATGDFIALIDSDDIWLEGKLHAQMEVFEKFDVDFVGTLHNNFNLGFPYKVNNNLIDVSFSKMMIKMAPSTITAVFKKSLIEKTGCYDEKQKHSEDANLWLRFSKNGKMVIINKTFAIAGDFKPLYGHSGLSSNLLGMFQGEQKNLSDVLRLRYINKLEFIFFSTYIHLKYYRRLIIVKLRKPYV